MHVTSPEIARRIEASEVAERRAYVSLHRQLFPSQDTEWIDVGDGFAAVASAHAVSPGHGYQIFSRCVGLGMSAPVTADELDVLEEFYRARSLPSRIDVCPLADSTLVTSLSERDYRIEMLIQVWARDTEPLPRPPSAVRVEEVTENDRRVWCDTIAAGFSGSDPPPFDPIAEVIRHIPGKRFFVAYLDDEPAGAAALIVRDGVAILGGAATRPKFRMRGVQSALLAARVQAARSEADLLTLTTTPAGPSQRNVERAGFTLAYTKVRAIR